MKVAITIVYFGVLYFVYSSPGAFVVRSSQTVDGAYVFSFK